MANKTLNSDKEIKSNQSELDVLLIKKDSPGKTTGLTRVFEEELSGTKSSESTSDVYQIQLKKVFASAKTSTSVTNLL